jgi:hypothetical protein
MQQQKLSERTFLNIDEAQQVHNEATGAHHELPLGLRCEFQLSDFYIPRDDQRVRELRWILGATAVVEYLTYKFV